eukprot:g3647.t1
MGASSSARADGEGAEVDEKGQSALHRAALSGEMEEVDRIVASGADIEAADKEGHTTLRLAVDMGHLHVVERLLEAKAHLEAKGGAYRREPPEAWKARKADQILIVFGPKRVGLKMEAT